MKRSLVVVMMVGMLVLLASAGSSFAQSYMEGGSYGMKVYFTNSAFYPFVMAYFRTMDMSKEPLVNVTPMNVGLMVQGRPYDPYKKQYTIQTLKDRTEGFRTVLVIDCSFDLKGQPFRDAIDAARTYIRLKTPTDEIAILALDNEVKLVSSFTKDANKLDLFLNDLQPTAKRAPIYDGIGRAMQLCATAAGSTFGGSTDYVVLSNILLFTTGHDGNSAVSKDNLMGKILGMRPPFPIYTLGYNKILHEGLKDLAALSEASYGRFWHVNSSSEFAQLCNKIQEINRHDYVVTFRSYLPVDGMKHNFKVILNYEGKAQADSQEFESMQVPPVTEDWRRILMSLDNKIPALPDGNPYLGSPIPGGNPQ